MIHSLDLSFILLVCSRFLYLYFYTGQSLTLFLVLLPLVLFSFPLLFSLRFCCSLLLSFPLNRSVLLTSTRNVDTDLPDLDMLAESIPTGTLYQEAMRLLIAPAIHQQPGLTNHL